MSVLMSSSIITFLWFLVWFLFYGPSTHFRSFRARSVNLATLFLGKPPRQFISILSQVTDNCSSWISGRGRLAVEMFSSSNLHERMCRTWRSNLGPLACQANTLLPFLGVNGDDRWAARRHVCAHFVLKATKGSPGIGIKRRIRRRETR